MEQENTASLTTVDKRPDRSFYIAWVFLTSLSLPVAYFAVVLFITRIVTAIVGDTIYVNGVQHLTEDYLALYFLVPAMGLLTGAVQYGLLRRYLPRMGWWVAATLGGWILGTLLVVLFIRLLWTQQINSDLAFLLLGLTIGIGQWLVLRRHLPAAGWWIVASLIGWGLLALVTNGNSFDQFGLFVMGFFPAIATAAALALLMKQVQPAGPQAV